MFAKRMLGLGFVVPALLAGCAAPDADEVTTGAEAALHSATDCPVAIEVEVSVPSIPTDAKLLSYYERDFTKNADPDPKKSAAEQLDMIKSFLAKARMDKKVSLRGEVAQGCAYKTFDAKTGEPSDYRVWLSNDGSDLRISQGMDESNHVLFFTTPIKKLSKTKLELDASKDGKVYAEDTSTGHDGSDGYSIWIGYTKISAKPE